MSEAHTGTQVRTRRALGRPPKPAGVANVGMGDNSDLRDSAAPTPGSKAEVFVDPHFGVGGLAMVHARVHRRSLQARDRRTVRDELASNSTYS